MRVYVYVVYIAPLFCSFKKHIGLLAGFVTRVINRQFAWSRATGYIYIYIYIYILYIYNVVYFPHFKGHAFFYYRRDLLYSSHQIRLNATLRKI